MKISLYAVNPVSGGEETELCFEISDGEHVERRKLTVTAEMFFELGFPHTLCGNVEISCGKLDEVIFLAEKTAAIKRGLYILSFADNTKKSLTRKLVQKGFSREAVENAIENLDVDFHILCGKRIDAMGGADIFAEKDTKQKAVAALLRYGFSYDDIKEALKKKR